MSLWENYNKERLGFDQIEVEGQGFIAYRIAPPVCFIEDVFIAKEFRRSNLALSLANQVAHLAKEQGCNTLQTQVWVGSVGAERAVRTNIAYGFKMIAAQENRIIFQKDIGDEHGK